MAKEIIWSTKAEKGFDSIINYLHTDWSDNDAKNFVQKTYKVLDLLQKGNIIFRHSIKTNIREVLITKHNLLLYREKGNKIELLRFVDTRKNPKKK